MVTITSEILFLFIILHVCNCERRIQHGLQVSSEKPYVVYFVKAPVSKLGYDFWLCGEALVTSEFVLTSAACIKDVDYLFAIAGYSKYVTDENINRDPCTSQKKKKVIYTCYPEGYELKYDRVDKWSLIDIGLARVESPFDLTDQSYKTICSYIPSVIPINYDVKYQEPGTDAMVLGWGHKFKWRKQEDRVNYNQENLNYAPVMIIDKKECALSYEEHGRMENVIDAYMICTLGAGNIDDQGNQVTPEGETEAIPLLNGCAKRKSLAFNPEDTIDNCEEYEKGYQYDDTRRDISKSNLSRVSSIIEMRNTNNVNKSRAKTNETYKTASIKRTAAYKKTSLANETGVFNNTDRNTRRCGICQNDHGGPLVTWVGTHEIVIGVASVFKVSDDYECTGPFLYTSTQCNGAFIDCILTEDYNDFETRRLSNGGTVDNIQNDRSAENLWMMNAILRLRDIYHGYIIRLVCDCERRIKDGVPVSTEKRYIVYLVKAPLSVKVYDAWVCGGAIVSSLFIITSAACVNDVEYMYAIAGYNQYIPDEEIETNPCTKAKKKKIIYTCVPLKYELEYEKLNKWSLIDIALVKVESPYDFNDESYKTLCSYIPTPIAINYEPRFQEPGTDGLVLGWGHKDLWRQPDDLHNYNQKMLQYASTRIMDKETCKKHYAAYNGMSTVIDKYMICTLEKGELDEGGQLVPVGPVPDKLDGCIGGLRWGYDYEPCDEDLTRREVLRSKQGSSESIIETSNGTIVNQKNDTRKSGICQNDHGGPLVTWVGAGEVIIGVASVFKVSDDSKCMGPYLYTSTQCNGAFLDCILSYSDLPDNDKRRAICDQPPIQRGYDTVERHISWKHHPAGAADNEVLTDGKQTIRLNNQSNAKTKKLESSQQFINLKSNLGYEKIAIRPQRPIKT